MNDWKKFVLKWLIIGVFSLLLTLIAIIYILSPIDAIPDVIPLAGQADDVVVGLGAGSMWVTYLLGIAYNVVKVTTKPATIYPVTCAGCGDWVHDEKSSHLSKLGIVYCNKCA